MTIELMELDAHGKPCALLDVNGDLVEVTCRWGSWGTLADDRGVWRVILPQFAAELCREARRHGLYSTETRRAVK